LFLVALLQMDSFQHDAVPRTPANSAADTYGSGYLDSLLSHQVFKRAAALTYGDLIALLMLHQYHMYETLEPAGRLCLP
jgi:hypothetical protein